MKKLLAIALLSISTIGGIQKPEGWEIFEEVIFNTEYFEEVGAYFEAPTFNKELIALEKTEIMLSGYYIPLELDSVFMISGLPFSSCFFCGGAGPETLAEIEFSELPKGLGPDEFIKVKGRLKLNKKDYNHLNFILQEAEIIK